MSKTIKLNKIVFPEFEVFDPEGNSLGMANENDLLDLRIQVKEAQIYGYYIVFDNQKILIDRNGSLSKYPEGLYDIRINYLYKLI